jgi:hypothetical protein
VPNQCAWEGGCKRLAMSTNSGLYGEITGANSATANQNTITAPPATASA